MIYKHTLTSHLLFLCSVALLSAALPIFVRADSLTVDKTFSNQRWSTIDPHYYVGLSNPHVTVNYGLEVTDGSGNPLSNGATLQTGQRITLHFLPLQDEDITWFGTGAAFGDPYGTWGDTESSPRNCDDNDIIWSQNGTTLTNVYAPFVMQSPERDIVTSSNLDCDGSQTDDTRSCTVVRAGSVSVKFSVQSTYGSWWQQYGTKTRDGIIDAEGNEYGLAVSGMRCVDDPNTCDEFGNCSQICTPNGQLWNYGTHAGNNVALDSDGNIVMNHIRRYIHGEYVYAPTTYVTPTANTSFIDDSGNIHTFKTFRYPDAVQVCKPNTNSSYSGQMNYIPGFTHNYTSNARIGIPHAVMPSVFRVYTYTAAGDSGDNGGSVPSGSGTPGIIGFNSNGTAITETITAPRIAGNSTLQNGETGTFTFSGSQDNGGSPFHYEISWDGSNTVSGRAPDSGNSVTNANNSATASISWMYTSSGSNVHTIKARAVSSSGVTSGWSSPFAVTVKGCVPTYACSATSGNIEYTNAICDVSTYLSCASSCTAGSLICNPNTPNISTTGECTARFPLSTQIISSNNPDGSDPLSLQVDWGDGNTNTQSGAQTGTQYTLQHSYRSTNTYALRARAVDNHGLMSPWGSYSSSGLYCKPTPPPTSLLTAPFWVQAGTPASIAWTSANTASCTLSGNNGDRHSDIIDNAYSTAPLTSATAYTLTCTGIDDSVITKTSLIRIVPKTREI